jgi:hypothetical protein
MQSAEVFRLHSPIKVRLRIDVDKLRHLIDSGSICAADFSCLDRKSKELIRELLLEGCWKGARE